MEKVYRNLGTAALVAVLAFGTVPGAFAKDLAEVNATSAGVEWNLKGNHESAALTISGPGGGVMRQEFTGGETPSLSLFDAAGERLPDGSYTWELRIAPALSKADKDKLKESRTTGSEAAWKELRASGKLPETTVQSGTFRIVGGAVIAGGLTEERAGKKSSQSTAKAGKPGSVAHIAEADQVIPDDLIVQGSGCFGFDCVNNESFGFDTIRLKENNLRIKFEDTSVGTFPTNDWQLTANDSASGGASKFSIEDITGAKVPFTITAGASTNAIFVDSTGRVGFRTSTPVLDLHVATSNTPALRLEQNNSGGFTAQTWDVAGNEANFFVRDVTGGSRLPFRIRPGAPTSSIDISADGDIGIGTASPDEKLHVFESANENSFIVIENSNTGTEAAALVRAKSDTGAVNFQAHGSGRTLSRFGQTLGGWSEMLQVTGNGLILGTVGATPLILGTNSTSRMHITSGGNVGIGLSSPVHPLHMASGAHVTAGGTWTNASSRSYKDHIRELDAKDAVDTLKSLNPVRYNYTAEPSEEYVGFIAEDVPELVAMEDRKSLSPMDVVAVLTKVVQEQQQTIETLSARLQELEKKQTEQP